MAGAEKEMYPVEFWRLKLGGPESDGLFMTCQLPSLTLSSAEIRHVGTKSSPDVTKIAVNSNWGPFTLMRGIDKKGELYKWIAQGLPTEGGGGGKIEKKEVTIELCDSQDAPIQTWTFTGCWPSNYQGPSLNANAAEHAVESITFEFDTAKVVGA